MDTHLFGSYPAQVPGSSATNLVCRLAALLIFAATGLASAQTITTIAGGGPPDGAAATDAGIAINGIGNSIATDSAGNLYITSGSQNRVYKINAGGAISVVAGNGAAAFAGDGGAAASASLYNPTGLAFDSAGNLYIADSQNCRVRKVSNGIITTVAGNGTCTYSGENGPALSAGLRDPTAVAVDTAGTLYIADFAINRVLRVANGIISTYAGNGTAAFSGDNGPPASASLSGPQSLARDGSGNLYIADSYNHRVRKVSGGTITTVAGNGSAVYSGDGGPAVSAGLNFPESVSVDSTGNLYITDSTAYRVRKVSSGTITTVAGNGNLGYGGDGGLALNAQINFPVGVAVDPFGNIYVATGFDNRVRKVANNIISTVPEMEH